MQYCNAALHVLEELLLWLMQVFAMAYTAQRCVLVNFSKENQETDTNNGNTEVHFAYSFQKSRPEIYNFVMQIRY